MTSSLQVMLQNEIINELSDELTEMDLFHFTLLNQYNLDISNHQLKQLLSRQSTLSLNLEINSFLSMRNSPYMILEDGLGVVLMSHKWSNFVHGPFKLNVIQESLKYYCTSMFYLYTRLWAFNPFFYNVSYPVLDIFHYPRMILIILAVFYKIFFLNKI